MRALGSTKATVSKALQAYVCCRPHNPFLAEGANRLWYAVVRGLQSKTGRIKRPSSLNKCSYQHPMSVTGRNKGILWALRICWGVNDKTGEEENYSDEAVDGQAVEGRIAGSPSSCWHLVDSQGFSLVWKAPLFHWMRQETLMLREVDSMTHGVCMYLIYPIMCQIWQVMRSWWGSGGLLEGFKKQKVERCFGQLVCSTLTAIYPAFQGACDVLPLFSKEGLSCV